MWIDPEFWYGIKINNWYDFFVNVCLIMYEIIFVCKYISGNFLNDVWSKQWNNFVYWTDQNFGTKYIIDEKKFREKGQREEIFFYKSETMILSIFGKTIYRLLFTFQNFNSWLLNFCFWSEINQSSKNTVVTLAHSASAMSVCFYRSTEFWAIVYPIRTWLSRAWTPEQNSNFWMKQIDFRTTVVSEFECLFIFFSLRTGTLLGFSTGVRYKRMERRKL